MCDDRHHFDRGPHHGPHDHRHDGPRDRGPDWHRDGPPPRDFDRDPGSDPFPFERRFLSRAEMVEALEAYLEDLENEAQGVREFLADLNADEVVPEPPVKTPRKRAPAKARK
jgi:hypothetical protein